MVLTLFFIYLYFFNSLENYFITVTTYILGVYLLLSNGYHFGSWLKGILKK